MRKSHLILSSLVLFILASCDEWDKSQGTFVDSRDRQTYNWVRIGKQIWMAENLNYRVDSGCVAYENNASTASIYGLLYTWNTACAVCPEGWHLPSDAEWKQLEIKLGMDPAEADESAYRGTDEGSMLKSENGWLYEGSGTDNKGFSVLPAGWGNNYHDFLDKGYSSNFWTSNESNDFQAVSRRFDFDHDDICRAFDFKDFYFSVRCIKD